MRYLVVLAALLVTPIAADASFFVHDSRDIDVEVTISVAGTVPLAGGDLVLDDAFVLAGTGHAFINDGSPPPSSWREAIFHVSGGGTSATGDVMAFDGVGGPSGAFIHSTWGWLMLDTPLYSLEFGGPANAFIYMGAPIDKVSFGAGSHEVRVTVGGEDAFLVGTASYRGTGSAAVPEPEATILLLVLGVTSIAVWRRRGA